MADDTPVDPNVDYQAGLADGTFSPSDVPVSEIDRAPAPVNTATDPADAAPNTVGPPASDINVAAADLAAANYYATQDQAGPPLPTGFNSASAIAQSDAQMAAIAAGTRLAQQQTAISTQRGQQQYNDWRVRLQLAQGANYLYKAAQPGILQPLVPTDGIIFPYTPKIDLSYKANYSTYEMTHSNYKGYFYQNSSAGDIGLTAHFTAQDTAQANYVLAVIHFFRSATKMFYGQDAQRGSPPPLVFLSGLGQYQFNQHPCLISEFTYNLPDDVDYIRAQTSNQVGLNLTSVNSNKQSVATNAIFASVQRLANAFTTKGALPTTPFGSKSTPNLASGSPTYVPTKIDITIRLLPVNTRQQVSSQFSVKGFANGDLLRGGFW
jgi:hypothetical protein